jgi:hypothetical protein
LWQYFLRLLAHLRAIPAPSMFGLTMRFAAIRRGGGGTIIVPHPNLSAKAVPPL